VVAFVPDRPHRFDLLAAAGLSATMRVAALLGRMAHQPVWGFVAAAAVMITVSAHSAQIKPP